MEYEVNKRSEIMCDHKIYRNRVIEALGVLGGRAALLDLVDCLADHYKVPEGEAYTAIITAPGVSTDHMEGIVSFSALSETRDSNKELLPV